MSTATISIIQDPQPSRGWRLSGGPARRERATGMTVSTMTARMFQRPLHRPLGDQDQPHAL